MRKLRSTVLGSFGKTANTVALIYLMGLVVLLFAQETKGKTVPEYCFGTNVKHIPP